MIACSIDCSNMPPNLVSTNVRLDLGTKIHLHVWKSWRFAFKILVPGKSEDATNIAPKCPNILSYGPAHSLHISPVWSVQYQQFHLHALCFYLKSVFFWTLIYPQRAGWTQRLSFCSTWELLKATIVRFLPTAVATVPFLAWTGAALPANPRRVPSPQPTSVLQPARCIMRKMSFFAWE